MIRHLKHRFLHLDERLSKKNRSHRRTSICSKSNRKYQKSVRQMHLKELNTIQRSALVKARCPSHRFPWQLARWRRKWKSQKVHRRVIMQNPKKIMFLVSRKMHLLWNVILERILNHTKSKSLSLSSSICAKKRLNKQVITFYVPYSTLNFI